MIPGLNHDRFLVLVASIAGASCSASPTPAPAEPEPTRAVATVNVPSQPEPSEPPGPPVETVAISEGQPSACDNDRGPVTCDDFDPGCEGGRWMCRSLQSGHGYRLGPAREIAVCFAGLGTRVCNIQARKGCYLQGIRTACPEPDAEAPCREILDRCRNERSPARFTQQECVQVLSSLTGGERAWAQGAMGPSYEGCRLMYPVY